MCTVFANLPSPLSWLSLEHWIIAQACLRKFAKLIPQDAFGGATGWCAMPLLVVAFELLAELAASCGL